MSVVFRISWISLAIVGVAIFLFGLISTVLPPVNDAPYTSSIGVASIGMGLFGFLITIMPYRRHERWAWFALWYYPIFWLIHLLAGLPPGKDNVHQIVFIVLSVVGLLLPIHQFFPRNSGRSIL